MESPAGLAPSVQWVAIERLIGHPLNANRMPPRLMSRLEANIRRSGRYPPLVVRSLGRSQLSADFDDGALQVIDGHHRLEVLRRLGHRLVRVDCWGELTDGETELLLATLNRLEGGDDAERRAELLGALRRDAGMADERLVELLPETDDGLEALLRLGRPPELPPPDESPLVCLTVFMKAAQRKIVRAAIDAAQENDGLGAEGNALTRICEQSLDEPDETEDQTDETKAHPALGAVRRGRRHGNLHPEATG